MIDLTKLQPHKVSRDLSGYITQMGMALNNKKR